MFKIHNQKTHTSQAQNTADNVMNSLRMSCIKINSSVHICRYTSLDIKPFKIKAISPARRCELPCNGIPGNVRASAHTGNGKRYEGFAHRGHPGQ